MIVTEETKAQAQAALDYIHAHPEKHAQNHWVGINKGNAITYFWMDNLNVTEENLCGTTMCVAGTLVYLNEGVDGLNRLHHNTMGVVDENDVVVNGWIVTGAKYLGLTSQEAYSLFFEMDEAKAVDMLTAIANGDEVKFQALSVVDYED